MSLGRTLRFQKTHSKPRDSSFWLPLDLDVELSATMSGYHHDPPQEDNKVNLWNHKPQSNAFFSKCCHSRSVISLQQQNSEQDNLFPPLPALEQSVLSQQLAQHSARSPGSNAAFRGWFPETGQRKALSTRTVPVPEKTRMVESSSRRVLLKISEMFTCQGGSNSKEFQEMCRAHAALWDEGAAILRRTMRMTTEKDTSIDGSSGLMLMAQGWGWS